MTRRQYLTEVIRLYLQDPDTPSRASRRDWAIAGELYRQGVPVKHLAQAIRIASLRRRFHHQQHQQNIRSLAYYRAVLQQLTNEHLQPEYIAYIGEAYRRLRIKPVEVAPKTRSRSQKPALLHSR